jgi:type I restriction enzyme S subunit
MIAHLKRYAEYKESGMPWLGDIPEHWASERAKWLFTKMDRPLRDDDEVVTCFRDGVVTLRKNRRLRGFTEATVYSGYQGIRKGDLVIHGMDAFAGAIGVSDSDGKGTPVYNVCQPRPGVSASYYAHLLRQMSQSQWILALAKGIRERSTDFRFEMFGNQRVPLPLPDEQAAIVRFLDWATGRLERAIRAKRKVIALLTEQKQAIIHRAVTRGLDPAVPLRPSSIPWLGDIPQHWEVRPLKAVCEIQSGITLGKDYVGQTTHEYPYLRVANVQAGQANLAVVKTIRVTKAEALRCMLQNGDVLMTEGGDPDKLGRGCVWKAQLDPCLHQNHVFAVRPKQSQLEPHFLSALMGTRYARAYFESTAKQTTNLASTNKTKIGQFQVLLPNVNEQQRILTALNEETGPVNTAIFRLDREIELLREYRTRLVADVVTGKLDVREAAARLPDEAAPAAAEDDADLSEDTEAVDEEAAV